MDPTYIKTNDVIVFLLNLLRKKIAESSDFKRISKVIEFTLLKFLSD